MKFSHLSLRLAAAASVVALLAATCYAAISSGTVTVQLHGVDVSGNPDDSLGQEVEGKSYKDSGTGIIVQIASGAVTNEFGRRRTFENQGLTITDPDGGIYTATADVETISRPMNSRFGWNNQIAVFETGTLPSPTRGHRGR